MQDHLQQWIERAFLALISVVSLYVGGQMKELSQGVQDLNLKLSKYIEKSEVQQTILQDHEQRIRVLENKTK